MDYREVLKAHTVLDRKYRIDRVIGAGGFGITYQAFDLGLAAPVAIKEYYPAQFGMRDSTLSVRARTDGDRPLFDRLRASFLREARTLAQFDHPAIVRVISVFETHGTAYMVMRFESGDSLKAWLKDLGRAPLQSELDRLVWPLLDAIELMHMADFLHRDIAPDNIIVRADGTPVLLDFGASRRVVTDMSGTLTGVVKQGYSPQEQYSSDTRSQGPWTDIYSLGATLYLAVTGRVPTEATARMLEDGMMPAADGARGTYRPEFLAAIDAAMRLRPRERPQSVAEWRELLFSGSDQTSFPEGEGGLFDGIGPGGIRVPASSPRSGPRGRSMPRGQSGSRGQSGARGQSGSRGQSGAELSSPSERTGPQSGPNRASAPRSGPYTGQAASDASPDHASEPQSLSVPSSMATRATDFALSTRGAIALGIGAMLLGGSMLLAFESPGRRPSASVSELALSGIKPASQTADAGVELARLEVDRQVEIQRQQNEARKAAEAEAEARRQEAARQAALQRQQDEARKAAEAEAEARRQEAARQATLQRQQDEARKASEAAEAARRQEAARQAALQRQQDEARKAAEAEAARRQEAARQATLQRQQDEARKAAEAEAARREEAARQAALQRQQDEARRAAEAEAEARRQEAARQAALQRQQDEARKAAEAAEARQRAASAADTAGRVEDTPAQSSVFGDPARVPGQFATRLAVTSDAVLAGGAGGKLGLWTLSRNQIADLPAAGDVAIMGLSLSEDGNRAVSGSSDGSIRIWDVKKRTLLHTLPGEGSPVVAVKYRSESRVLALFANGKWVIAQPESGEVLLSGTKADNPGVTAAQFAEDGKVVFAALADGADGNVIEGWVPSDGSVTRVAGRLVGHTGRINAVSASADGELVASASDDGTVRVWKVDGGRELHRLQTSGGGAVRWLAFSGSGTLVAGAGADGTVDVWQTSDGQRVASYRGPASGLQAALFSPDGDGIVASGSDGVIRRWLLPAALVVTPPVKPRVKETTPEPVAVVVPKPRIEKPSREEKSEPRRRRATREDRPERRRVRERREAAPRHRSSSGGGGGGVTVRVPTF
ncbi:MAG: protein kinase [Hyphomicrobiaceae bacterium]